MTIYADRVESSESRPSDLRDGCVLLQGSFYELQCSQLLRFTLIFLLNKRIAKQNEYNNAPE